jgi:uncharacterized protein YceH (UPF0502 family)
MGEVMTWYQFAVFVFAMIMVNVLTQAVIRGFWGQGNKESNSKNDKRYVNHQTFSYKIEDVMKNVCSLRQELEDKVHEDVCLARMEKLEVIISEIRKRLDSIEAKLDRMLHEKE